ncbi:hypothetical protein [Leucobacter manosquensis]|uniref:DUF1173 domain-containing protein n=1 Tax=Leucobacter manosquensis TaxID=2810611 RepID=A0ABS5M815_9MICO|nr:hypothetical protein [Leucobacter manosquensis]MBS3183317.1 hypothetical protein [Leucobacter manosquensis]
MGDTTTSTSHALHVPSGEIISASQVGEATKPGPWECPSNKCRLALTPVRATLVAGQGASTIERGPFFKRKTPGTLHTKSCDLHVGDLEKMSAYTPRPGNAPRNETVLLSVGSHPNTKVPEASLSPRTQRNVGPDYAGRAGSMASLLRLIERMGGEEAMKRLWHSHHGQRYRWQEIAYGAEHSEYVRLRDEVTGLFKYDEHRPWIIWGTVQEGPKEPKYDHTKRVLRVGATYGASVPKVRVYVPNTSEFEQVIENAIAGTDVAFVLSGVKETDVAIGVYGNLKAPSDIAFLN